MLSRLTVLHDERCILCLRCRDWMVQQEAFLPIEFLGAHTPRALQLYGAVPWLGDELVVVADSGEVWVGPAAFLICLWALVDYREWSYRLTGETFSKVAIRFFTSLSRERKWIASWLRHPGCSDESCRLAHPATPYR